MILVHSSRKSSLVAIAAFNWLFPVRTGVQSLYKAMHHEIIFSSQFSVPSYCPNLRLLSFIWSLWHSQATQTTWITQTPWITQTIRTTLTTPTI